MCISNILEGLPLFSWVEEKANAAFDAIDPKKIHEASNNKGYQDAGAESHLDRYRIQTKIALVLVGVVLLITLIAAIVIAPIALKVLVIIAGTAGLIGALALLRYNYKLQTLLEEKIQKLNDNNKDVILDLFNSDYDPAVGLHPFDTNLPLKTKYEKHHYPITAECFTKAREKWFFPSLLYMLEQLEKYESAPTGRARVDRPSYIDLRGASTWAKVNEIATLAAKLNIQVWADAPAPTPVVQIAAPAQVQDNTPPQNSLFDDLS